MAAHVALSLPGLEPAKFSLTLDSSKCLFVLSEMSLCMLSAFPKVKSGAP